MVFHFRKSVALDTPRSFLLLRVHSDFMRRLARLTQHACLQAVYRCVKASESSPSRLGNPIHLSGTTAEQHPHVACLHAFHPVFVGGARWRDFVESRTRVYLVTHHSELHVTSAQAHIIGLTDEINYAIAEIAHAASTQSLSNDRRRCWWVHIPHPH